MIILYVFSQFNSDANLKFFPRLVSLELKLGFSLAHLFLVAIVFVFLLAISLLTWMVRAGGIGVENKNVWSIDPPSTNESFGWRFLEICGVLFCDGSKV